MRRAGWRVVTGPPLYNGGMTTADLHAEALATFDQLFEEAAHGTLAKWGVKASGVEIDLDTMHGEKSKPRSRSSKKCAKTRTAASFI